MNTTTRRWTMTSLLATMPRPERRSRTARLKAADDARRALAKYKNLSAPRSFPVDETDPARLQTLLWAQAFVERALALETQGRLGNATATPSTVSDAGSLIP